MPFIALIAWIATVLAGLFLLAIWLIEYDPDYQRAAATRLPVLVIIAHALLAVGGLVVWVAYVITDRDVFAWSALADIAIVVTFGMTMAVRWIGVYRGGTIPAPSVIPAHAAAATNLAPAGSGPDGAGGRPGEVAVPPERHFPVSVVIGHGILAFTTLALVLITTTGIGGS